LSPDTIEVGRMTRGQVEKRFPRYALAYIRFLAGERDTVPTPTPQPIYDGITPAEIPDVQRRVVELLSKVDLERAKR
jgi:hypothetical protein